MAVTKIHPIKSTLKKALDYIENPDKTEDKMLVSSFGCSYETADIEFEMLLAQAIQKGNNLAHHLIQSFAPGEATPEQAHEIGKQLADEVLQFEKCAYLAKKALTRDLNEESPVEYVRDLEKEMLEKINKLGIGPGGLGGTQTALAINIETYPTHIAGLPVAVNICCHVNRHSHRVI